MRVTAVLVEFSEIGWHGEDKAEDCPLVCEDRIAAWMAGEAAEELFGPSVFEMALTPRPWRNVDRLFADYTSVADG